MVSFSHPHSSHVAAEGKKGQLAQGGANHEGRELSAPVDVGERGQTFLFDASQGSGGHAPSPHSEPTHHTMTLADKLSSKPDSPFVCGQTQRKTYQGPGTAQDSIAVAYYVGSCA